MLRSYLAGEDRRLTNDGGDALPAEVEGLRVADASVMPLVTTGNTNAPSIMIGERVADFLAGQRSPAATMAAAGS